MSETDKLDVRFTIFLFFILTFNAYADKFSCDGLAWPYSRDLTKPEIYKILKREDRLNTIQYAFYEMYHQQEKSMLMPLLHYLESTEKILDLKSFYESMGHIASDMKSTPEIEMRSWPKRTTLKPMIKGKKQVCKLYYKAKGTEVP